ncbi:MAG TPA: glycosyltransferase [Methanoregulaceae archaeon]|nr:glycosyltransferase [Methanoregulaceae archaeon]
MNILVIPTTDWTRHPVPNRLNFIFDILAERHKIFVLHFHLRKFENNAPRPTRCQLIQSGPLKIDDPSLYYVLNAPFHFFTLKRIARKEKIDVILSANILPSFMANWLGIPIVFDYLDHLEESASVYYPGSFIGSMIQKGVRTLSRFNLAHADRVITVTEELKKYLAGLGIQNVAVIPNGVDTGKLVPLDKESAKESLGLAGKIVLGYVGSLEYWVDLETAVLALPELPNVVLLIVGPSLFTDYAAHISRLAEEAGVKERVIFKGAVPYDLIGRYISAMDVGLNPLKKMKKNEFAAGGKVFNYLSCGRPVLSSRMISLERLLGDALFYYDDVGSFSMQTKKILEENGNEEHFRAISMRFDWKTLANSYESVLEEVQ